VVHQLEEPRAVLLGPNPGNGSYSTTEYFRFLEENLQSALGEPLASYCPGERQSVGDRGNTLASLVPRRRTWFDNYIRWPQELRTLTYDLFHVIDQGLGWYSRFLKGGRRLATIHDLFACLSLSGKIALPRPPRYREPLIRESIFQLRRMDHLVCVSQYTADCVVRELKFPASRITVVPNHLRAMFRPLMPKERVAARSKWFSDAEQVVLHVGKPSSYKNRPGVIRSFQTVKARIPSARLFLVHGPGTPEELALVRELGLEDTINFLPPLKTTELTQVYGAADVFVFPSVFEGFGWPPIEAMACACPVVCSRGGALGEVVGDAALTVDDPFDCRTIGEAVIEVLASEGVRRQLRERGLRRVEIYRPESILPQMAAVYRMLLRN